MQDGATPLWIASQMGHAHVVRELLVCNASVDAAREVSRHDDYCYFKLVSFFILVIILCTYKILMILSEI